MDLLSCAIRTVKWLGQPISLCLLSDSVGSPGIWNSIRQLFYSFLLLFRSAIEAGPSIIISHLSAVISIRSQSVCHLCQSMDLRLPVPAHRPEFNRISLMIWLRAISSKSYRMSWAWPVKLPRIQPPPSDRHPHPRQPPRSFPSKAVVPRRFALIAVPAAVSWGNCSANRNQPGNETIPDNLRVIIGNLNRLLYAYRKTQCIQTCLWNVLWA